MPVTVKKVTLIAATAGGRDVALADRIWLTGAAVGAWMSVSFLYLSSIRPVSAYPLVAAAVGAAATVFAAQLIGNHDARMAICVPLSLSLPWLLAMLAS